MKIKKLIEINDIGLLITDDDNIYSFDNSTPSFGLSIDSLFQYYIKDNVLFHKFLNTVETSNYNPVKKLNSDEIVDYLHLIL